MPWFNRAIPLIPTAICLLYAGAVAIDAFYVGLIAEGDALAGYSFDGQAEEWRLRSPGHYFWYGSLVSAVFALIGLLLKRVLKK